MSFCDRLNTPYGERLLNIVNGDKILAETIYNRVNMEDEFVKQIEPKSEVHQYLNKLFKEKGNISIDNTQTSIESVINTISENTKDKLLKESLDTFKNVLINSNVQYTANKSSFSNVEDLVGTSKGNKFTINSDKIMYDKNVTSEDINRIIVHELVHNATTTKLDTDEDFRKQILEYKNLIPQELLSRYKITDEHEFVAELFSNKNFVDEIKTIPHEKKSLIGRIFDSILKSLGITSKENNVYNYFKTMVIENTPNEYKIFSNTQHNFLIGENATLSKVIKGKFNKATEIIDNILKEDNNKIGKSYNSFSKKVEEDRDEININEEYFAKVRDTADKINKELANKVPDTYMGYDGKLKYDTKSIAIVDKNKIKHIKENMFVEDILDKEKSKILQIYPDINKIKLKILESGIAGYDVKSNTLYINPKRNDLDISISHEIQHYIQVYEGFALGQNIDILSTDIMLYSYGDSLMSYIKDNLKKYDEDDLRIFAGYLLNNIIKFKYNDEIRNRYNNNVEEFLIESSEKEYPKYKELIDNNLIHILNNYASVYDEYIVNKYYNSVGEVEARYVEEGKSNYAEYISNNIDNKFYNVLYDIEENELSKLRNFIIANPQYPFENMIKNITVFSKNGVSYGFYKDGKYYHPFVGNNVDFDTKFLPSHVLRIMTNILQVRYDLSKDFNITYSNIFDAIEDGKEIAYLLNDKSFLNFKSGKIVKIFTIDNLKNIVNKDKILEELGIKENDKPIIISSDFYFLDNNGNRIYLNDNPENLRLISIQKSPIEIKENNNNNNKIYFKKYASITDFLSPGQESNKSFLSVKDEKNLSFFLGQEVADKITQRISRLNPIMYNNYSNNENTADIRFIDNNGNIASTPTDLSGSEMKPILYGNEKHFLALTDESFKILNLDLKSFLDNDEISYICEEIGIVQKSNC